MIDKNTCFPMWDESLQAQALAMVTEQGDQRMVGAFRLMFETGIRPTDASGIKGAYIDVCGDQGYLEMPISKQSKSAYTKARNTYIKKRLTEIADNLKNEGNYSDAEKVLALTVSRPRVKLCQQTGDLIEDPKKTYFAALYDPYYAKGGKTPAPAAKLLLRDLRMGNMWGEIWRSAEAAGNARQYEVTATKKTTKRISADLARFLLDLNSQTDDDYIFSTALSKSNFKGSQPHISRQTIWAKLNEVFSVLTDKVTASNNVRLQVPFKLSVYSLRKTAAWNVYNKAKKAGLDALAEARDFLNHASSEVTKRYLMLEQKIFMMWEDGNYKMA
ncbi:TPA: hypothetical protein ACX6R8_003772 [Photobacterium damselae]